MAKILVVDDEIKIREIIKEYAEFEGYEVAQAEDGNGEKSGFRYHHNGRYDAEA